MLSKTEQEYLNNPARFSSNYGKVLKHRVATKARAFNAELKLLSNAGLITQSCNLVTDFSNPNQSQNQDHSMNQGQVWSLRRDLDPRPLPYQGNAPPG
jgi:hypothetical protein